MNSKEKFSFKKRLASFRFAFNGLKLFIKTEHNAWIHIAATLVAIGFGAMFKISKTEWIEIFIVIGFVFSMEIINAAIERLCDFIYPDEHEIIKQIKDISAAAVLVSALVALIVGVIIFLPKIF
ncbi:diacylglycerol kinase [Arachidicoccus ginsenosidimutans]|uniref:diacylglycerol kinase family protein n=1 Tax=Arachidicoccus sp. BS20 TaxID=1850526 RepID=UPI0007F15049|nr:diacylglycerol kinase family protein [Arachidicoccus sp. BS20]ANI89270.1 diacylglycerol kinase [Arachidicoccus sp. BS20]